MNTILRLLSTQCNTTMVEMNLFGERKKKSTRKTIFPLNVELEKKKKKDQDTHQEVLRLNISMYNGSLVQVVQCRGEVTHHGAGILLSVASGTGNGIKQVTTLKIHYVEGLVHGRGNITRFLSVWLTHHHSQLLLQVKCFMFYLYTYILPHLLTYSMLYIFQIQLVTHLMWHTK